MNSGAQPGSAGEGGRERWNVRFLRHSFSFRCENYINISQMSAVFVFYLAGFKQ